MPLRKPARKVSYTPSGISSARLAAMIDDATVDAYGDAEQTTGWYTVLDEHLALPFQTTVLGVVVTVARLDLRGENEIVAICTRGCEQQAVPSSICPYRGPSPQGPSGSTRTVTGSAVDEVGYAAFARHHANVLHRVIDLRIFSSQQL